MAAKKNAVAVAAATQRPGLRKPPHERPPFGLSMPCRVMGCFAGDHLLLHLPGSVEFELVLIDCCAPPLHVPSDEPGVRAKLNMEGMAARDAAYNFCQQAAGQTSVWIPQPIGDRGWAREIKPGSKQAGYLFLADDDTLNDLLVATGACHLPRRATRFAA